MSTVIPASTMVCSGCDFLRVRPFVNEEQDVSVRTGQGGYVIDGKLESDVRNFHLP